jgi:hypothetical protein
MRVAFFGLFMIFLHMECSRDGARTVVYVVRYAWVIQMLFVEVNYKLRLSGYNPFVLAHQVEVYYMSYPCRLKILEPWWIVQKVCPPGRLLILRDEGYDECELDRTVPEAYQEDECNGPFEVDIGMALDKLDGDTGDIIVSEVRKKK